MAQRLGALLAAILLTYCLAVAVGTVVLMNGIAEFGIAVSFIDRLAAVGHDLLGMAPSYLPLISIAMAIALPLATQIVRRFVVPRVPVYLLAGFAAMIALHKLMEWSLGLIGFASARTLAGLMGQALAGALGGAVYAWAHRSDRHASVSAATA